MPRDAQGNYTLPPGNPVISGTTITAEWANATMPDLGNEMTNSLSRSGQGGMLVPFRVDDGTVLEPAFSFNNEITMGMYRISVSRLGFGVGATLKASISPDMDSPQDVFTNEKLGGYQGDGTHSAYTGDLNDIEVNSRFNIAEVDVTNAPTDFAANGVIDTIQSQADGSTQILWGRANTNSYRVWWRGQQAGVWVDWKKIIDGDKLTISPAGTFAFANVPSTDNPPIDAHHITRKDYVDDGDAASSGEAAAAQATADQAILDAATADGKAVAAQGTANTALSNAAIADGKAVAAQGTADTALANAATADGKAVAAQGTADTALANANAANVNANSRKLETDFIRTGDRLDINNVRTS